MALTDAQARKAAAKDAAYKLSDAGGLFLYVSTTGVRSWRLKYRFAGKEKLLTLGQYPEVTLSAARELRDQARRQLRENKDPTIVRRQQRAAAHGDSRNSFEAIGMRWWEDNKPRWAPKHAEKALIRLKKHVFPEIGSVPIREVTIPMALGVVRKCQAAGMVETGYRLRQMMSAIFVYAGAQDLCSHDPAEKLGQVMQPLPKAKAMPALTSFPALRQLIADVEAPEAKANVITVLANRFLALTAARPGMPRAMSWSEIEGVDWDTGGATDPIWRVPAARMKLELHLKDEEAFEHIIPLSRQAVEVLLAVRPLTRRAGFVFPQIRYPQKPMSDGTISAAYKRAGYAGRHVPHGWRAAFSTLMNERAERLGQHKDREVIDLFLAHIPKGVSSSEGSYNRASYLTRRRELAQEWADLLLGGLHPAGQIANVTMGRERPLS
jgi:integrase